MLPMKNTPPPLPTSSPIPPQPLLLVPHQLIRRPEPLPLRIQRQHRVRPRIIHPPETRIPPVIQTTKLDLQHPNKLHPPRQPTPNATSPPQKGTLTAQISAYLQSNSGFTLIIRGQSPSVGLKCSRNSLCGSVRRVPMNTARTAGRSRMYASSAGRIGSA